jgi:hypothetical protein
VLAPVLEAGQRSIVVHTDQAANGGCRGNREQTAGNHYFRNWNAASWAAASVGTSS